MNGWTKNVLAGREGQRIDNYLFTQLRGVPKGLIYRLLRTGKIRVNGKRVKQTYRLQENDEIKIPKIDVADKHVAKIGETVKQQINDSVLYEDQNIIVINKPAGLAVHPGSKVAYGVIEVLRELRSNAGFLELVHRLDRETSGCLLIAKNKITLSELHELFRTKKIDKKYMLLVKGEWDLGEVIIDTPLQTKGYDFEIDDNKNSWKEAYTTFQPEAFYDGFTFLTAQIETGRTHQIRIHAAQSGFPIVGDSKYGDFAFNRVCKKMGLRRMFLHAGELSFQLSDMPRANRVTAPLSDELTTFIQGLDQRKGEISK